MSSLHSSLLIRDKDSSEWTTNFDVQILTLIKEAEHISRLGLRLPPAAKALMSRQSAIMQLHQSVNVRSSPCYIHIVHRVSKK